MIPVQVSPPAKTPVMLADLKRHVAAEDFADDDLVLQSLIEAAVSYLDGYSGVLGRCLVTQTWAVSHSCWKTCYQLPFPDVSAVVITYLNPEDQRVTLDADLYELVQGPRGSRVVFRDAFASPSLNDDRAEPVTIEMTVGYGQPENVPKPIRTAILILAAFWYDHEKSEVPHRAEVLFKPYRRVRL